MQTSAFRMSSPEQQTAPSGVLINDAQRFPHFPPKKFPSPKAGLPTATALLMGAGQKQRNVFLNSSHRYLLLHFKEI